jgi:hypothetical protein
VFNYAGEEAFAKHATPLTAALCAYPTAAAGVVAANVRLAGAAAVAVVSALGAVHAAGFYYNDMKTDQLVVAFGPPNKAPVVSLVDLGGGERFWGGEGGGFCCSQLCSFLTSPP